MKKKTINRRDFIKGLSTVPVLGALTASGIAQQTKKNQSKQNKLFDELNLNLEEVKVPELSTHSKSGELIRLGIIGVGSRGEKILQVLGFSESVQKDNSYGDLNIAVTGVCDVYDKHAEKGISLSQHNRFSRNRKKVHKAKRFHNYEEMLESDEVDAVIIATPDHWHAKMTVDAARAGKHIYAEKCLTRTVEEAYQVRDEVKNSRVVFQYGHQNRQQKSYFLARQIIEKNVLGKITVIKTHTNRNKERGAWIRHLGRKLDLKDLDWELWQGEAPHEKFTLSRYFGWQKFFEYSGGLPAHMFSHEYDAINQVLSLGIPKSVMANGGIYYWKDDRNTPDVFQAIFEYPEKELLLTYDATLASATTGEYESGAKVKEILGSDAWMKLGMNFQVFADRHSKKYSNKLKKRQISPTVPIISYLPDKPSKLDAVTSATQKYYASQGLIYTYEGGKKIDVTYLHVREWLDCIRNGTKPSCDIDLAFDDTITCLMATKSYLEGRKVEWDVKKQRVL